MSRGRGYSRGYGRGSNMSYRGSSNSYRGSSHRGSSNYNGSSSGGGGRYNSYNDNSYESSSRGSRYQNSSDRSYNNRENNYKRPSSYNRDRERSPDRKRSRHEQGSRRSHDGFGGSSGDYSSGGGRYESSSYDKRHSSSSRQSRSSPSGGRSFRNSRDDISSTSSHHHHRKEPMGPPKSLPPRSSRGVSFRGRINSTRGIRRARGVARRTAAADLRIKRRYMTSKSQDYTRKLKIAKLRSTVKKRSTNASGRTSVGSSDKKEAEDEDNQDINAETSNNSIKTEGNWEDDDVAHTTAASETPTKSPKKPASVVVKTDKEANGEEAADKEDESGNEATEADKDESTSKKDEAEDKLPKSRFTGKTFIKLTCTHCYTKCLTFKEYSNHLFGRTHKVAMRRLALKQKAQLSRMRLAQRNAQRDIEEKSEDTLDMRSQFCLLCRLNYRQPKVKHQMSEAHRNMKKFLMPYCRTCRVGFKSPMVYEAHRCSLDHIKRKARMEAKSNESEEEKELDLDNFMTVDSVGDVDCTVDIDDADLDDKHDTSGCDNEKQKQDINVGNEHVKKVEVYYCELCRIYLSRKEDPDVALKRHCAARSHLKSYVRYKEDQSLRLEAERIHRKHHEAKDTKGAKALSEKDKDEKSADSESKLNQSIEETDETGEDKMWADVDKDLGELLRQVGPEATNDDDDDEDSRANTERYDRFKYSEKSIDGQDGEAHSEEKTDTAKDVADNAVSVSDFNATDNAESVA